ncbi:hypothetical protein PG999_009640 [Apiospora kogelbergensis]|uniref:Uncharacterized protein n=1 Tax=Apiospora kogelbergensis TaxID=1337665 RepID=A0AAW0QTX3_9PEZI
MPLRQLQRPLLRTTIAAAAPFTTTTWPPTLAPLLRATNNRRRYSTSDSSGSGSSSGSNERWGRTIFAEVTKPQPHHLKKTLFEELFPAEAKAAVRSNNKGRFNGSTKDGKVGAVPGRQQQQVEQQPPPLSLTDELRVYADIDPAADEYAYDNRAILVLSGAPKSLTESDFFRTQLGGPARHVEGWSSTGIHRIIPVRDVDTLEHSGQYYILFESGAAAAAWKIEVMTLWRLARAHTLMRQELTGITPPRPPSERPPPPQPSGDPRETRRRPRKKPWTLPSLELYEDLLDDDGNLPEGDLASVRHFTLVPPSMRYDVERPVYSRVETFLDRGAPSLVEWLMRAAGTQHLVLLVLEGGRLSVPTLHAVIREDGVERNLPWRLKNPDGPDGGIMAFGKSSLKAADQAGPEDSLRQQLASAMGEGGEGRGEGEAAAAETDPAAELASLSRTARERQKLQNEYRRWNRFIVPFLDEAEARRFVRRWHRRQLQLKMGHEDSDVKAWEESRTINASILW